MTDKSRIALPYNDYTQSANSLIHFMGKVEYLKDILQNKAIVPRYCMENIDYLNIHSKDVHFKEIAVLQKCFCDISLQKLTVNFNLNGTGDNFNSLSDNDKLLLKNHNTHPDFYGNYAIAFSKEWGEKTNLQPVHYINSNSTFAKEFSDLLNSVLNSNEIPVEYVNDILNRLSFLKPLHGIMKRKASKNNIEVEFIKNFHDEKEWRYVPCSDILLNLHMESIIANPNILNIFDFINTLNQNISSEKYKSIWLLYDYEDIRYIIVPDLQSRIDIINTIMSIPRELFKEKQQNSMSKYILISKIIVLNEMKKDW